MMLLRILVSLAVLVVDVSAHGALTIPPSRNAAREGGDDRYTRGCLSFDNELPDGYCPGCVNESCLWFSGYCVVGCPVCSLESEHGACNGSLVDESTSSKHNHIHIASRERSPIPAKPNAPWTSPGAAPVLDVCGVSGGGIKDDVPRWSSAGDLGSKLPATEPTVWVSGSTVEVAWAIAINHKGGYQYRLCPADQELTEECMQRTPLPFASHMQKLRFPNGTELSFNGTFISDGTHPKGSEWARSPLPYARDVHCSPDAPPHEKPGEQNFPWCPAEYVISEPEYPVPDGCRGPGSLGPYRSVDENGCFGLFNLRVEIVDEIVVPASLPPGRYVLGWRWDCETEYEVWSHCADIKIEAATSILV